MKSCVIIIIDRINDSITKYLWRSMMNIRLLKIFKEVYEHQSITKATEALYISQPAVSQAIQELESVLNRNLFIRKSGGIEPTSFGTQFYTQVIHFLKSYHQFEADVFKLNQTNRIRIGSSITVAKTLLPEILMAYESLMPKYQTNVTVANAQEIIDLLVADKVDVGIIEGYMHDDAFHTIDLGSYELSFFSKTQRSINTLEDLLEHRILLREPGSSIRDAFDVLLAKHDLKYQPVWQAVNSEAIIYAVSEDLGVGFLPSVLIDDRFHIYENITPMVHTPITLCYRKNQVLEKPLTDLVAIIQTAFRK